MIISSPELLFCKKQSFLQIPLTKALPLAREENFVKRLYRMGGYKPMMKLIA